MKRNRLHLAAATMTWLGLSMAGCTTAAPKPANAQQHDAPDHHAHHQKAPPSKTPGADAAHDHGGHHHTEAKPPATGALTSSMHAIPELSGDGPPREVRVLVDRPELKLAIIVLRNGTELPEHTAPVPVTIQVLQGAGLARFGEKSERFDASNALLLEAGEPHAITPDAGTTMVLLVHYLRNGETPKPSAADDHHGPGH